MSERMIGVIEFIAIGALLVAGLLIAAGMSYADMQAAVSRKTDRVAVASTGSSGASVTVARTDGASRTTTLVRTPIETASY
jgi:hypothetical protein